LEAARLWKSSGLNGSMKKSIESGRMQKRREEKRREEKRSGSGGLDAQLALTGKKEQFGVAQGQARRSLPDAIESG
jgi:hypothetical protein